MNYTYKNGQVLLPPDFVEFIRRNYERIEEIEKKVEQFQLSWRESIDFRFHHPNLKSQKLFESVDSCFSEEDVRKVITARIKPKLSTFGSSDPDDNIGDVSHYFEELGGNDPEEEYYDTIRKNFPLVYLSHDSSEENQSYLIVEGSHKKFCDRSEKSQPQEPPFEKPVKESKNINKGFAAIRKGKVKREQLTKNIQNYQNDIPKFVHGESFTLLNKASACTCVCNCGSKVNLKSPNDFVFVNRTKQLTLPPLHSSVLTLLGQRSGVKSSPRLAQRDASPTSGARHKKLRRHGRTKKGEKEKSDEGSPMLTAEGDGQRAGSEEVKKADEPHETQISAIDNNDDQWQDDEGGIGDEDVENLQKNISDFQNSRQALHTVLDDFLTGKPWSPKEMSNLDEQIEGISQDFQKLQTKFQTESIKMKAGAWLLMPRTWSRNSAVFRAPSDIRTLRSMKPLEYLEKHVTISEARKHLYSLVFQRYRTMENPAGKTISLKTVQMALSEIIGRKFLASEMNQLCSHYLHLQDMDLIIYEETFLGISAFCERIYVDYSLEDGEECHECFSKPTIHKMRCHKDQKSHLEQTDLGFLFGKVRDGEIHVDMYNLIITLCNRD